MKWIVIVRKLHPQNLINFLIEVIVWMMEAWAILRAIIIMLLVVVAVSINAERLLPDYDTIVKKIGEDYESSWIRTWLCNNDQSSW